ncbi:hypothetical protein PAXRUDRAFT_159450 [Paxillus rubicundulus Ve08.2h10]|uniref:Uncharacterized protein n=1 Tax=Paxillus rubicundulus Ve08.2h10 TaxID=930991 RepID=A0A0D0CBA8_9AGAM|nr:hypothetical protein PAXRUDRAFT_159450 [Paxillus rubicundulus Ve08.2h10]
MEHSLHLGAKSFLVDVCPTPLHFKKAKSKSKADNEEVNEVEDFEPGDLLGKVLALITQVRLSPQAKAYFAMVCKEEGLKPLELIKWIHTHWGSMCDLLECLIQNKSVSSFIYLMYSKLTF